MIGQISARTSFEPASVTQFGLKGQLHVCVGFGQQHRQQR